MRDCLWFAFSEVDFCIFVVFDNLFFPQHDYFQVEQYKRWILDCNAQNIIIPLMQTIQN